MTPPGGNAVVVNSSVLDELRVRARFIAAVDPVDLMGSIVQQVELSGALTMAERELVGQVVLCTYSAIVGGAEAAAHFAVSN